MGVWRCIAHCSNLQILFIAFRKTISSVNPVSSRDGTCRSGHCTDGIAHLRFASKIFLRYGSDLFGMRITTIGIGTRMFFVHCFLSRDGRRSRDSSGRVVRCRQACGTTSSFLLFSGLFCIYWLCRFIAMARIGLYLS